MNRRYRKMIDEPNMSDKTLLLTVEDLISTAFGPLSKNSVNFKLIQTILHILARQLRLLEQNVEIKFDEIGIDFRLDDVVDKENEPSDTSSSSGSVDGDKDERGRKRVGERKDRDKKGGRREGKDRDDRLGKKERQDLDDKGEKREKKVRDDKGEKKDRGKKGETGTKKEHGQKEERGEKGRGLASSKDRDRKRGSKDRGSPSKSPRHKAGDDDGGEQRDGGRYDARDKHHGVTKSAAREGSQTSITVTEASRVGAGGIGTSDKILIAERGPTTRVHGARVGSIEVVTASQFALLEKAVKQLQQVSGPLPMPALPDNQQLRKDLAEGRASLSDTMQAVQLNARVQAAEQGLSRMAGLLTQLAAAGALPSEMLGPIGEMQAELQKAAMSAGFGGEVTGSFGADAKLGGAGATQAGAFGTHAGADGTQAGADVTQAAADATQAGASRDQGVQSRIRELGPTSTVPRMVSSAAGGGTEAQGPRISPVTHSEMQNVLEFMREEITKEINNLTARANHSADVASKTSRSVAEKLAIAMAIDARISSLLSQTDDYATQLSGFDSGLVTQMASFQEQMAQINTSLREGLQILETANNNAETAAVVDLTDRYEGLVLELDNTVHMHKHLTTLQKQIGDELRSLVECVEMLREQKADRDEVLDGLRDKADISRLAGLLYEKDFAQARSEIEKRLDRCYEKFNKQDLVWQLALRDLTRVADRKAELMRLMALKDITTQELNGIQKLLQRLEIMLGEPKAALLMRRLATDAACGACLTRAVMPQSDAAHGLPHALPPLRAAPHADEPCLAERKLRPPDDREHTCHRWVGGSHTLMGGNVLRVKAAETELETMPTKKFEGYGTDGKLYMMEEDLQPCAECNKLSTDDPVVVPLQPPAPSCFGDHV